MKNEILDNSPTILVTGATGFIGRILCSYLCEKGYRVRGTYRNQQPPLNNSYDVEWQYIPNIGPETDWCSALSGVDYVVHLAGLAHQMGPDIKDKADEFISTNAFGTRKLARDLLQYPNIKRLIYMSSIGAATTLSEEVVTETTVCQPDTDYGQSKYLAEQYVAEMLENTTVDWCILRPPLVYGPENPGNMERLQRLITHRLPLPFGGIENKRSFIYVGNLIHAIESCLQHNGASRETFLVSDSEILSTRELTEIIGQKMGITTNFFDVPRGILSYVGRVGDLFETVSGRSIGVNTYSLSRLIGSLHVSCAHINSRIGWYPPYTFEDAIDITLNSPTQTSL